METDARAAEDADADVDADAEVAVVVDAREGATRSPDANARSICRTKRTFLLSSRRLHGDAG